jgi:cyclase
MCNNGWIVLDDHVLVIDANMPGRTEALVAAVRRTTNMPIKYLFNTHHHGDHVYGNRALVQRTGAT